MLEESFIDIYTRFKLHFYQTISKKDVDDKDGLTIFENMCMEGIIALEEPTVAQFGKLLNLSTPNAAYKVNNLIKKGYLEKIQSTTDRREYHLKPTKKYMDMYNISYSYLHTVVERVKTQLPADEVNQLDATLQYIARELMQGAKQPES